MRMRERTLFGQNLRARAITEQTALVRQRAREILLEQAPPEGYRSVDEAYADAENTVRASVRQLYADSVSAVGWRYQEVAILARELALDFGGYGPVQPLLDDPEVGEIMVRGTAMLRIERGGRLEYIEPSGFRDEEHLRTTIDRILLRSGRRLDESCPYVDTQIVMDDGSLVRVHAIIPPVSIQGAAVTIRKFRQGMGPEQYQATGAVTPAALDFLAACVRARLNIIVSGGTGSGKTSLLNVLGHFIPADDRVVTVEDALELSLPLRDVTPLLTRPANIEGQGEISIRLLVKQSLRMRPDRILVGETRSGEALDMLQAMNTGHDGSMGTVHANSATDALSRLETLVLMAGMELPLKAVRDQVASAVDLIVQVLRTPNNQRRVVEIASLDGLADGVYRLTPLFSVSGDKHTAPLGAGRMEEVAGSRAIQKLMERGQEEVSRRCFRR